MVESAAQKRAGPVVRDGNVLMFSYGCGCGKGCSVGSLRTLTWRDMARL